MTTPFIIHALRFVDRDEPVTGESADRCEPDGRDDAPHGPIPNGGAVPNVVVVDPQFDAYVDLAATPAGKINLHFRSSGADAIKLARRIRIDVWLVGAELHDVSGVDFVGLLRARLGTAQLGTAQVAVVETGTAVPSAAPPPDHAALPAAAALLSPPITFGDVERLLGPPAEKPPVLPFVTSTTTRPFVTLPLGVSAAVAAVAVLFTG